MVGLVGPASSCDGESRGLEELGTTRRCTPQRPAAPRHARAPGRGLVAVLLWGGVVV